MTKPRKTIDNDCLIFFATWNQPAFFASKPLELSLFFQIPPDDKVRIQT